MNIELKDVWYRYEGSHWILKNVSTALRGGEIVRVVGPNGGGKTTFMKVASLLYKPTRGSVLVDGVSFWSISERLKTEVRRKVVYVHEKPIMLRGTVMDNVIYGLTVRGVDIYRAVEIASDYLRMFKLENVANERAHRLSLGQAQLIAIIRAVIVNPAMVFLDEALANIDDERRSTVLDLVARLRDRGTGVVISAHEDVAKLLDVDRVIAVSDGMVEELG